MLLCLRLWRGFFSQKTTGFVRPVTKWLVLGVAATAKRNGRLIRGQCEWLALVIDQRKLAFNEKRAIRAATNIDWHIGNKLR
jgi:hypothetical protein